MKLSKREKIIVSGVGGFLLLIMFTLLVLKPVLGSISRYGEIVSQKQDELREIQKLREEYLSIQAKVGDIPTPPPNFSLLSYLENMSRQSNVKIDSIKPGPPSTQGGLQENTMDVKIERITLKQLADFLYKVEVGGEYPLTIRKLHIKTSFKDPNILEVSLQIVTFKKA